MKFKTLIKTSLAAMALACASTATAASTAPYPGGRIFWDMSSERFVSNSGGYARVIELQDGRLMCVFQLSGIVISVSEDGGNTWSNYTRIASNPSGISEATPDLRQLRDGTIVVCYNPRPSEPYSEERKFGIRCRRSTDNGQTWSKEIYVHDGTHLNTDGSWEPSLLELPSGELHCYFTESGPHTHTHGNQISVSRSFDGGLTWSDTDCVSHRPNNRDGMPSAILLEDPDEIVVIIEDSGYYKDSGPFTPSTVRCPLDVNWHDYHVGDIDDPNRNCVPVVLPNASMGAPYITRMPNGLTIASCQGFYQRDNGNRETFVWCGDERARNFRAMSRPFHTPMSSQAMWPSLAVVDHGEALMAVAGVDSQVKVIKGYPMKFATIAYSNTIKVDGKMNSGEVYTHAKRNLLPMGTVCLNRTAIDMAFDNDSLYFTARVFDDKLTETGGDVDAVRIYLDPENLCTNSLQTGLFRLDFEASGTLRYRKSSGTIWRLDREAANVRYAQTKSKSYYIIEAAMAWNELCPDRTIKSVNDLPDVMRINIEINDVDNDVTIVEAIPETNNQKSATWFEIHLDKAGADGVEVVLPDTALPEIEIAPNGVVKADNTASMVALDVAGRVCAAGGDQLSLPGKGLYIIRAVNPDGAVTVKKIIL